MAPSIRLHTQDDLGAGGRVQPDERQVHYLATVMRCRPGDPVSLFNGRDGEWRCRVVELGRRASLAVEALLRPQAAEPDIWLVFALLKRTATELLVQKACELGVSALLPVVTGRTQPERVNHARLRAIAIEAAEQSERLSVPDLRAPQGLAALLQDWPAERRLVAAIERRPAGLPAPAAGPVALLTGPEGGFTPAELDALMSHPLVLPVSLGPRVLRAETAAIAGLALLVIPSWKGFAPPAALAG